MQNIQNKTDKLWVLFSNGEFMSKLCNAEENLLKLVTIERKKKLLECELKILSGSVYF